MATKKTTTTKKTAEKKTTAKKTTTKKATTKKAVAKKKDELVELVAANEVTSTKEEIKVLTLEYVMDKMDLSNSERDTVNRTLKKVAKTVAQIFVEEYKEKSVNVEIKMPLVDYKMSTTEKSFNVSAFAPNSIVDLAYDCMMGKRIQDDDEEDEE